MCTRNDVRNRRYSIIGFLEIYQFYFLFHFYCIVTVCPYLSAFLRRSKHFSDDVEKAQFGISQLRNERRSKHLYLHGFISLSPVSEQKGRCKRHRNNPSDLVCSDSTILSRVILSESHSSVIYASKSVEHSSNHLRSVSINLCYRILFSNNVATKENVKDSFDILFILFLPSRLYSFMTYL